MVVTGKIPQLPAPRLHERALDLLFPPLCVGCRRPGRWICQRCWPAVPWRPGWNCPQCGDRVSVEGCRRCPRSEAHVDVLGTVAAFEGSSREAVHALKYHERHAIASMLGRLMAELACEIPVDVVTYVPLHKSRRRERGYDQSALLARHVAHSIGKGHECTLVRTRRTQQQALLERDARSQNVAGAFQARHALQGEHVLLIDDVATTGATLGAAAQALRRSGAGSVTGLVFAHAL